MHSAKLLKWKNGRKLSTSTRFMTYAVNSEGAIMQLHYPDRQGMCIFCRKLTTFMTDSMDEFAYTCPKNGVFLPDGKRDCGKHAQLFGCCRHYYFIKIRRKRFIVMIRHYYNESEKTYTRGRVQIRELDAKSQFCKTLIEDYYGSNGRHLIT